MSQYSESAALLTKIQLLFVYILQLSKTEVWINMLATVADRKTISYPTFSTINLFFPTIYCYRFGTNSSVSLLLNSEGRYYDCGWNYDIFHQI